MRLAASFFRSDSQTSSNDSSNLYQVDSETFETVHIPGRPRIVPPGESDPIQIKFPTRDLASASTSCSSLPVQPVIDSNASLAPWVHKSVFDAPPVFDTQPTTKNSSLAKTMFILGFFFPLLWLVGASRLWRHTAPPSEPEAGRGASANERPGPCLPEADKNWAWGCIWAFVLLMVAISGTLLSLSFTRVI